MIWDALRYGFGVAYVLVIEGIPVVWSELATDLTLPAGFDQLDPSLVIDRSASVGQAVDRDTGMGQGLPLSFQLLDSEAARGVVQRWSRSTYLTSDLGASDTTANVADTTGFPSEGVLHIGQERITYSGLTSTTFTGLGRGAAWSPARRHIAQGAGAVVTDKPKVWRGRGVRLFAIPVAPDGSIASDDGTLLAEAVEVWRGYVDQGPRRESGRFAFDALSLDRLLSQSLPAAATGTVVDGQPRGRVYPGDHIELRIIGYGSPGWDHLIRAYPYADLANSALLTLDEQRDRIIAAWSDAVTAAGAGGALGALTLTPQKKGGWRWNVIFLADSSVEYVLVQGSVAGDPITGSFATPGGLTAQTVALPWWSTTRLLTNEGAEAPASGMTIQLDAIVDDVPEAGLIAIGGAIYSYDASETVGALLYVSGLSYTGEQASTGSAVQVLFRREGAVSDLMLAILTSEGGGGTYDVWGYGEGYALTGGSGTDSAVDEASFALQLAGPALDFEASVGGSEPSFESQFSGLLTIAQRGIVARPDASGYVRLGVVSTEPAGSAYVASIGDAELLSLRGDPVEQVSRTEPLAALRVTLVSQGETEGNTYTLQEFSGLTEQAGRTLDLSLPVAAGQDLRSQVTAWGASLLATTSTLQTLEIRVVPWVRATVGDLVRLQLTHPNVWSWLSGTPGYDGLGRVLGATRDLRDGALTLTVLIDGAISVAGLVPAMLVLSGSGTSPTTVDVSRLHLPHLQQALASGPILLRHYQPGRGDEGGGGELTVASVTDTGSVARLTVSGTLTEALSTTHKSHLCYPESSICNGYQGLFAHTGDGSVWS